MAAAWLAECEVQCPLRRRKMRIFFVKSKRGVFVTGMNLRMKARGKLQLLGDRPKDDEFPDKHGTRSNGFGWTEGSDLLV